MSTIRWYGPTLLLLVTVLTVMVAGPGVVRRLAHEHRRAQIELVRDELASSPSLAAMNEEFRRVAEVVAPSVVQINVFRKPVPETRGGGPNMPETLRRWLERSVPEFDMPQDDLAPGEAPGDSPGESPEESPRRFDDPAQPRGHGSGWVYDDAGHIVTNHHVVDGADRIDVRFHDGTVYRATLVASDPKTDVAVLHIEGADLIPAARSTAPARQGEIVFAFGSPFGFEGSMSQGVVSAVNRSGIGILERQGGYENFIQTDAAINRGNSGGPLVNINGQVVGMNTAIATNPGAPWAATFSGLGFAIPIEDILPVAQLLITEGRVARGFLGISMSGEDLTPEMAATFGYQGKGVLVEGALPGYPAADAGLIRGDIITHVNGSPVTTNDQLRNLVANYKPGETIEVKVFREGDTRSVKVTLAELPSDDRIASGPAAPTPAQPDHLRELEALGLTRVEAADEQKLARTAIPYVPGVLVTGVRQGSAMDAIGVRRGSIITEVAGQPVTTIEALALALRQADLKKGVRLSVKDPISPNPRYALLRTDN